MDFLHVFMLFIGLNGVKAFSDPGVWKDVKFPQVHIYFFELTLFFVFPFSTNNLLCFPSPPTFLSLEFRNSQNV